MASLVWAHDGPDPMQDRILRSPAGRWGSYPGRAMSGQTLLTQSAAVPTTFSTPPRVLSLIPPMTQLNTPYPSTAYLTGFLRSRGVQATQADLALGLVLELLSARGLREIAA